MALVTFVNDSEPYLNAENLNNNFESCVTPSGAIMQYAGTTAPDGWLICDGSAINRTTYSDLFDVIGTTYGSGDGSTTFNLPNLKGRIPVGLDSTQTEFDTIGETGGSKEMQKHSHSVPVANVYVSSGGSNFLAPNDIQIAGYINSQETGTGNSGNLQPYIVLNYIIKY